MRIYTYKFSKKLNSTAQPVAGSEYDAYNNAVFLDDTDILNPSIRLVDSDGALDPTAANYARIFDPGNIDIDRYYFINTWRWTNEGWIAEMTVDVLATYKMQIGGKNLYILRSASTFDTDVVDNMYPVKASCQSSEVLLTNPWTYSVSSGSFIIGVISKGALYGSVRYVAMDYTNFATLCSALLNDNLLTNSGFSTSDATLALQKSLVDPLQYIVSCVFVPIALANIVGTSQPTLDVWDWTIPVNNTEINLNPYSDNSQDFTLPKHPATSARGNYLNTSPYTRVELNFPPFGTIELDTSITATHPYIYLRYSVDYISGEGTLKIYCRTSAAAPERILLGETSARVGVPIQLSQVDRNHLGVIGGVVGAIGSLFTGNIIGAAAGIGSAATSAIPHQKSSGTNGTFYQLQYDPSCFLTFMDAVPDDNADHGRPLMGFRTISNLSGFVQCEVTDITITNALRTEIEMILQFLKEGFYYE